MIATTVPSTARGDDIDASNGDATADSGPSREARAARTAGQAQAIRTLLAGTLPDDLYTTELFQVDLLDESAVAKRRVDLTREISVARRAGARPIVDAGIDASASGLADLDLELAEARLAFLSKPRVSRQAVLESERERRRALAAHAEAEIARKAAEGQQQAAEDARRRALDEADSERDATKRALANERARAEGVRAELAAMRSRLAAEQASDSTEADTRSSTMFALTDAARTVAAGSADADSLYDRLVAQLEVERASMKQALDAEAAQPLAPRYEPDPIIVAGADPLTAPARAQLGATDRELAAEAARIESSEAARAWSRLNSIADRERQLNTARLSLLARLSPDKVGKVLGLGSEGIAQLRREMVDVRLVARWRTVWINRAAPEYVASLKRTPALLAALTNLALFALLVGAVRFVRRHGAGWLDKVHAGVVRVFRRGLVGRALGGAVGVVEALIKPLALVGGVLLTPRVLGFAPGADTPIAAAYRIVGAYTAYRLFIVASHQLIARAAGTPLVALAAGRSDKVLRSLHVAGRYALFVEVLLTLSASVLGRGYLYNIVLRFAWLGGVPIAAVLIRWWRADIATEFLKRRPEGPLSDAVRGTQRRWYGFFVAIVAVVVLFIGWVATSARRFILGFEHTRKALAYLFRRRLEKRANAAGEAPDLSSLPLEFRQLFEDHTPAPGEAVDRYPELERFLEAFDSWRVHRGAIGAFLLVGKTGYGKSSWVHEALQRAGEGTIRPTRLERRVLSEAELVPVLASAIGVDAATFDDLDALVAAVGETPRRLVVLDDVQNLFQRGVGALAAWVRFNEIVAALGDRVFWLCTCAHYPYEYLAWARRHGDVFRTVVTLSPWPEADIAKLIQLRMARTKYTAVYEDLIVDEAVEGVNAQAQLASTGDEYMRLLWDYAEGSPRAALHCWLRSLVADGDDRVRVRLFRQPDTNLLEQLDEEPKFVLAAVVWHESLAPDEAARALQFTSAACGATLARLRETGILENDGDRYRVAVAWWPPVIRYLRRKHLVDT